MGQFRIGAIALIDALGVKGIWRGPDGETTEAIATLRTALKTAKGIQRYLRQVLVPNIFQTHFDFKPTVAVLSLSDSLVIAAQTPANRSVASTERVEAGLVDLVCQCTAYVMRKAAQEHPPLVYRGVVTSGRMLVDRTFLLGEAVDDAALRAESANGAFVWLLGRAAELPPPRYGGPNVWDTMICNYPVPLKDGQTIHAKVVSPFVDVALGSEEAARIRAGYESAMRSDRAEVVTKRNHTMAFIDHVCRIERK